MVTVLVDVKQLVLELVLVTASDAAVNVQGDVILDVLELVLVTASDVIHSVLVAVILDVQVTVKVIVMAVELVLDNVVLCAQQHVAVNV